MKKDTDKTETAGMASKLNGVLCLVLTKLKRPEKLCKDCIHCDGHPSGMPDCLRTKYRDKVNNSAMEGCRTERCLPWLGAVMTNMCGKTGRFFKRKEA